ncbi:diacylglycerol kinase [Paracoccus sediminis]|uniref:Diacylglycerol kinase n=1 Tax=Paracoccus sediminis TaxID=1214787 RepID=A0A238WUH7_9RHOB|nr:diacylglycerol kinase family protein [Paracoccus sediminis]TBN50013.1 diacylglycerol kinase [Paracoccus sediminis]SNR50257.1 Diacylglycerol kinase family enzyme [Paracoccus sediminis]
MRDSADKVDLSACRLCVIRNRGSGKKDPPELLRSIRDALQDRVAEFELRETSRGDQLVDLARQAADDGFDIVVALGGDGTQSAVAGALAGTDVLMGVLPGGTFNYFARDLGVGETFDEALATLAEARVRSVDVGQIENLVFLNNVSFGAYPHILKTREGIYKRWGRSRLAAYWSVLVALRRLRNPMHLTATVDGRARDFTTALVFIARSAYQLDSFGLDGADAIRAGNFAVLIAKARRPLPLLRSAFRLAFGFSAKDSDFDLIITDRLTIETGRRSQLVAHDGEKTRMVSPFHLQIRHGALNVLVPADGRSKTQDPKA